MLNKVFSYIKKEKNVLIFILALILTQSFVFQISIVPTGSMYPNIFPGDLVFITKYSYGYNGNSLFPISLPSFSTKLLRKNIQRGDIIVFKNKGKNFIKRAIGLPGDKVQIISGTLFLNDIPIKKNFIHTVKDSAGKKYYQYQEEINDKIHYTIAESINFQGREKISDTEAYYVPQGHYFCLGDHRSNSADSRFIGCIKEEKIIAKARYVVFCSKSLFKMNLLKRNFSKLK